MALTRDQLLAKLAQSRARRIELTWAQFVGAVGASDASTKAALLAAVNKGDGRVVFTTLYALSQAKKLALATEEVELVAADDSLTIDELIGLLS